MKDVERYSVGDDEGRYLVEILTQNDWWMLDLEEEDRRTDFIVRLIALVRRITMGRHVLLQKPVSYRRTRVFGA
ncbi:hypothetical protein BLNAU_3490 [Blattamonas nauphoetae]|uniref:Uncharacterized protein n=1 Tax=Blattamonas nauphoetae TaxID=2049346 RepID=A0ABQ9YD47_9EUKA|nr:hypothetical protein BLNAU_3490 [Blattamonas nauphoetae]